MAKAKNSLDSKESKELKEKLPTAKALNEITSKINKSKKKASDITSQMIINWLFDNNTNIELPHAFIYRQYKLKQPIDYTIKKFRKIPKMQRFVNDHVNNLYSKRSESEILVFLKSYIQINKLDSRCLDNSWFKKSDRDIIISKLTSERDSLEGNWGDIVAEYDMICTQRFNDPKSMEIINETKPNQNANSPESNAKFEEALKIIQIEEQKAKMENDPRFLKELNQNVVDEWNLSLIDIKTIEKQNKILLIFIDKNNNKKFFVYDFIYEFVVSNIFSIIYNDYVVPFNKDYHYCMVCTDFRLVENIRRAINDARDKFYKEYAWF